MSVVKKQQLEVISQLLTYSDYKNKLFLMMPLVWLQTLSTNQSLKFLDKISLVIKILRKSIHNLSI